MNEFNKKTRESSIKSGAELDDDTLSDNPFELEFDKKSVVNPSIKKAALENKLPDSFADDDFFNLLLKYDEDKYRQQAFRGYIAEDEEIAYSDELQQKFRDFLELRKISGKVGDYPQSNLIPSRKIIDKGDVMEIVDDPKLTEHEKSSTVLIHRNKQGEALLIEVLCSCGKRTFIRLNYESEMQGNEETSYSGEVKLENIIDAETILKEIHADKLNDDTAITQNEFTPQPQESLESDVQITGEDEGVFRKFDEAIPLDADSVSFEEYKPKPE